MFLFPEQTIIYFVVYSKKKLEATTILRKYSPSLLTVQKKHLTSITVVDLDLKVTGTN